MMIKQLSKHFDAPNNVSTGCFPYWQKSLMGKTLPLFAIFLATLAGCEKSPPQSGGQGVSPPPSK